MKVVTGNEVLQTPFDTLFVRLNPGENAGARHGPGDDRAAGRRARHEARRRPLPPGGRQVVRPRSRGPERRTPGRCCRCPGTSWPRFTRGASTRSPTRARPARSRTSRSSTESAGTTSRSTRPSPTCERYTRFYSDDERLDYRVRVVRRGRQVRPRAAVPRRADQPEHRGRSPRRSTCSRCGWPTRWRSSRSSRRNSAACCRCACATATASSWTCRGRSPGAPACTCWSPTRASSTRSRSTARRSQPQLPDVRRNPLQEDVEVPLDPSFLYSNRSYWYVQSGTSGYSTARIAVTVPDPWVVVASGDPVSAVPVPGPAAGGAPVGGSSRSAPTSRSATWRSSRPGCRRRGRRRCRSKARRSRAGPACPRVRARRACR